MIYLILLLNVIIIFEIIHKSNYFYLINSLIKFSKKASKIILDKKISDHWKEKIIPNYSLKMLKVSMSMLLILTISIVIIYLTGLIYDDFLPFVLTIKGIITSFIFAYCYFFLKNFLNE